MKLSESNEASAGAEFLPRLQLPTYGRGVAFSFDSQHLYAVDSSMVFSFGRGTGERVELVRFDGYAGTVAASPTEPVVACTTGTAVLVVDGGGRLMCKTPLTENVDTADAVAFSPNGAIFAVGTGHLGSKATTLEIFSGGGKRLRTIKDDVGYGISQVCFTGDSEHVITVRGDPMATKGAYFERWTVGGGQPRRTRIASLFGADSLSSSKGTVAMCSRAGVALLDENGGVKWRNGLETERVAIAPDASFIVAGKRRAVTVFSVAGKVLKTIVRKSTNAIRALAISDDGWLAIGTDGGVEMQRIVGGPSQAKRPAMPKTGVTARQRRAAVTDAWRRIDAWLAAYAAAQKMTWRDEPKKGATQEQIAAAEKTLGISFPADLIESLRIHDGADSLIGNWSLLGVKGISRRGAMMNKLAKDDAFGDAQGGPHPRIRRAWWNPRWIPIVSNDSGHFFCVDMDPTPKGKAGQVILFFHDEETRLLVADSVREWLNAIASDLEAGRYEYLEESGTWSDEAFLQSSAEGKRTLG